MKFERNCTVAIFQFDLIVQISIKVVLIFVLVNLLSDRLRDNFVAIGRAGNPTRLAGLADQCVRSKQSI